MSSALFSVVTGGEIALTAATARTVLAVVADAGKQVTLRRFTLAFDGTAVAENVAVELCQHSVGGAGTSSAVTPVQWSADSALTTGFTAAKTYTVEPTTLTPILEFSVPPNGGVYTETFALGDEPQSEVAKGLALRLTAPAGVNVRATMVVY